VQSAAFYVLQKALKDTQQQISLDVALERIGKLYCSNH
jgi:hypothetical protein